MDGMSGVHEYIKLYKDESITVFNNISIEGIAQLFRLVWKCYQDQQKIFVCGNGGNVGFIENLVVDWNLHPFVSDDKSVALEFDKRLNVINLCSSAGTITGVLNDLGGEHIFSEQLKYQGKPGDMLLAISGSGNSKNIVKAMEKAKQLGMIIFGITKNENSKTVSLSDYHLLIQGKSKFPANVGPNEANFYFEDNLSTISHMVCGLLRARLNYYED